MFTRSGVRRFPLIEGHMRYFFARARLLALLLALSATSVASSAKAQAWSGGGTTTQAEEQPGACFWCQNGDGTIGEIGWHTDYFMFINYYTGTFHANWAMLSCQGMIGHGHNLYGATAAVRPIDEVEKALGSANPVESLAEAMRGHPAIWVSSERQAIMVSNDDGDVLYMRPLPLPEIQRLVSAMKPASEATLASNKIWH